MSGIAETHVTDARTTSNLQNGPQVFTQPSEISALTRTDGINVSEIPETHVTDAGTTSNLQDGPQIFIQPTEISSIADAPPSYNVAVQQQLPSEEFSAVQPQENSEGPPGYNEAVLQGAVTV